MCLPTKGASGIAEFFDTPASGLLFGTRASGLLACVRAPTPNHCPNAPEKTHGTFDACLRPAQFVFNRGGKQNEQSRRVRTERFNHFVRIDAVAEALRHRLPIVG